MPRFDETVSLRSYVRGIGRACGFAGLIFAAGLSTAAAQTPVAGQNVNMVAGTTWPGGDPFLQRQNEPSLAVSSRNALHLLAGANDYRTVDLPVSDTVPGSLAGDAWLGVFKSYDGGLSWQSYLLPGYPQDQSPVGLASPLKAYNAAADPTVRAGASGLLYYSGIAFNRGTNTGGVFVSTFFDTNQKENGAALAGGDSMQYQRTVVVDTGTSGQFLDKTWIAVDVPRSGGGSCLFPGLNGSQTVLAGNVYLVWSRFTGSTSTKIMFSRSLDCGKTWANPTKLSESSSVNQGTNLAIDPASGKVYAVWRQFKTSSNPEAILVARSDDFGRTFPSRNTVQVATIAPFDQAMTGTQFRTNTLPSVAASVDANGTSRVHVAWAQRTGTSQDARIVVSTSSDSGKTWSAAAPVDGGTLTDDSGNTFTRGHQFMPQLTFASGRLMLVYYDQRLDHTLSLFKPNNPFVADGAGRFYLRTQALRGELKASGGEASVFTLFVDDNASILAQRRHTIDLRVADALPAPSPSFASASVSQYRMGLWAPDNGVYNDDEDNPISPQPPDKLYQLQVNAPNLPMFSQGTLPFLGDYIDVAGQNFVSDPVTGKWSFSTASTPPVFYATWTDNRDVVPPIDPATNLVDWSKYTPPYSAQNPQGSTTKSIIDPTQNVPPCDARYTGSRNQNVYVSRITEGLLVGSPQGAKPLFAAPKQRAFVVTAQNFTAKDRVFKITVAPGSGVAASFQQTGVPVLSLTGLTIGARSGLARPVFASSANPAGSLTVNVTETTAGCSPCLSGAVVLNPEGSVSPLAQPDGSTDLIGSVEVYTPSFAVWNPNNSSDPNNPNPFVNITDPNQNISNQNISNQNISNADPAIQNISNQNISNQNISNQNISNQNISNASPAIQNISNQNISNQNISNVTVANQNISNQNISNQNISNQNISNAPYTDANYAIVNAGNTAHSYRIKLYGNNPNQVPLQVIVTKNSQAPTSVNCTIQSVTQSMVLAEADGTIATTLADATNPNILDGSAGNVTVAIGPGETVFLTLRGQATHDQMLDLTRQLSPVITAHGTNTNGSVPDFALLLSIQTTGGTTLPVAVVGTPYSTTLTASGGKAPLAWILAPGSLLPTGLTLSTAGVISGTPSGSGSFTFTAQVTDSTPGTPQTASQTFSLTINARTTSTAITLSPNPVVVGQPTSMTVTVTDTQSGTVSAPTGTVALTATPAGSGLSASPCVLVPTVAGSSACTVPATPTAQGSYTMGANFTATAVHLTSGATTGLTVNKASTGAALTSSANPSVRGQAVTLTATLSVTSPGAGTPTGTVTFSEGATVLGAATLSGGAASVTVSTLSVASHSVTAAYGGDANFNTSSSSVLVQQVGKASSQTSVTVSPNPSLYGQPVTLTAAVAAVAPGSGTPTGSVTFYDGATVLGTATLSSGSASLTTAALGGGAHSVTAVYSVVDANFTGSSSAPAGQVVIPAATATGVASSLNPSGFGQLVTFTASVTSTAGVPTGGIVTFLDGTTTLGTATLSGGTASFPTAGLSVGPHSITAAYGGGPSFGASTSSALTQTVQNLYTFTGFLSPMATAGTIDAPTFSGNANYGSATPVKWKLQDSAGNYLSDLTTTQVLQAAPYPVGVCSGQASGTPVLLYSPTVGAKGGSTYRYDAGTNQFIFNWNTGYMAGPGCYELELQLNDGSAFRATIEKLQ